MCNRSGGDGGMISHTHRFRLERKCFPIDHRRFGASAAQKLLFHKRLFDGHLLLYDGSVANT